jgi:hypothetical protein
MFYEHVHSVWDVYSKTGRMGTFTAAGGGGADKLSLVENGRPLLC